MRQIPWVTPYLALMFGGFYSQCLTYFSSDIVLQCYTPYLSALGFLHYLVELDIFPMYFELICLKLCIVKFKLEFSRLYQAQMFSSNKDKNQFHPSIIIINSIPNV